MTTSWGNTLLIANPVAQNGRSASLVDRVAGLLRGRLPRDSFRVELTKRAGHAVDIAREAQGVDTVLVLGGDGIVHEAANGLMARPADDRPVLGVIASGSGNDFAKAIGIPFEVEQACETLLACEPRSIDVGQVNDRFFVETLSFGLDAAIALDTVVRRKKTGRTGTALYMESGFDQLLHHLDTFDYALRVDNGETKLGQSITFAVQNGPYYGGGFKVCPDAQLDDGAFDLCIAHPPIGVLRACWLFLQAKDGRHTKSRQVEMLRATSLHLEFSEEPPAQTDGERLRGTSFDVRMHPSALRVLAPRFNAE
ncbi:diacylglycerol/lipid kinase family protein [Xiamenia xianingshaonis]|uniref:Diacylglycerol kinase family lipid kinase n=1 Tax=Xiamenia xianingshaonis TaxID=2682776 RepID=A0A9E6MRI2_9ACTN|nr:diacylglycerol kinase family protein [Xiamenia xianingshaonis]NHM14847.1 YegS/Rv2252/BmrU family lipid kinase [Xiamenia xianingshaonis]QTU84748.1 diacylglycerol kinase family lipid kinase [Xiamenia xianingshaonis]